MDTGNYIAAVDLGSSNVAVAVGEPTPDGLRLVETLVLPMQGIARGDIVNIEQVTQTAREAITEIEHRLGTLPREIYTGISGEHIKCAKNSYFVFVGGDGEIRPEDVRNLSDNMRNVQPEDGMLILDRIPENYRVDGDIETDSPVGRYGRRLDATFNFILGNEKTVERHDKALAKLNINTSQRIINAVASARAVTTPVERELGVAVLDIGGGTTDLCVIYNHIIRYVGVIPIGSDAINKDIRSCSIPERWIETIKVECGYAVPSHLPEDRVNKPILIKGRTPRENKTISHRNLAAIIEARLLDLAGFVKQELRDSGHADKLEMGLVLTGGGSLLHDIDLFFHLQTGLEVRVAAPDQYVDEASREAAADLRLSTAIGMLLMAGDTAPGSREEHAAPNRPQTKETVPASEHPDRTPLEEPEERRRDEWQDEERRAAEPQPDDASDLRPDDRDERAEPPARREKKRQSGWLSKMKNKIAKIGDNLFGVVDDDTDVDDPANSDKR